MKPRPASSTFSLALSRAALIGTLMAGAPSLLAYQPLGNRWETTATDGFMGASGTIRGDATTLTWGFANEGTQISRAGITPNVTNTLISTLNAQFGGPTIAGDLTTTSWFGFFDRAYERWDTLSGLTMTYEANDDGATMGSGTSFSGRGILGTRADLRIGGLDIDGGGAGVLAFNYAPDNGDHVMDVSNISGAGGTTPSYGAGPSAPGINSGVGKKLSNVIMHEAGHGLGFGHLTSADSNHLLEPVVTSSFWGPQLDDILGLQRLYGDAEEKGSGNDTFGNATGLGTITSGGTAMIGTLGDNTAVSTTVATANAATDFISIDGTSDTDFFSFTVGSTGTVDVTLNPRGTTYMEAPNGGTETPFVSDQLSNLQVQLLAADGTTVLATGSGNAAGINEMISAASLTAGGTYFIKVATEAGATDDVQLYGLDVAFTATGAADGNIWDINGVTAGAGGATPNGNWSGATNWTTENTNTAAGGNTTTSAWNNNGGTGNVAVFSAGADATGTFTVNSDQPGVVLTGVTVEEGNVTISGAQSIALNETPAGTSTSGHSQGNTAYTDFFITPGTSLDVQVALTDDGTANDNLEKTGGGLLELSGANTYGGRTRVIAGELRINGSITSNTTVATGATLSGTGSVDGDIDMQAGSHFNPGSAATGNLNMSGTGNTLTFDTDTNLNYELATPFATKAAAAQSGDHLTVGGGNSLIFDGDLNITDVGGFASGFYELASVADETINFTNDSSDFTDVPSGYAYRIESGIGNDDVDLVVADTPDVLFANGSNILNLNLGTFAIGATGMLGYNIENALGSELLRLFAEDVTLTGSSGMTGLFGSGFGSAFDLNGGDSMGLTASFLGSGVGSYNASYTFGWNDFEPGALGNITGLLAGNGTDTISGDFYLPEDYFAGEITLNLFATVAGEVAIPEPSRAVLLVMGLSTMLLRRRRS